MGTLLSFGGFRCYAGTAADSSGLYRPAWRDTSVRVRPIVAKVEPLKGFYAAEGYHQDFLAHNPTYPYIVYNDLPKIAALKKV